jgi:hypothetical protein
MVPAAQQRAALAALLATLQPAELDTPERLVPLLSAAWSGSSDRQFDIEVFATAGGSVFDPLVAAETAAGMTIEELIAPTRLTRLVDQHRRAAANLGPEEVLGKLTAAAFTPAAGRLAEIQRRVQTRLVIDLARTAHKPDASPAAVALLEAQLNAIAAQIRAAPGANGAERAHRARLLLLITDRRALEKVLEQPKLTPEVPPGMPIGDDGEW